MATKMVLPKTNVSLDYLRFNKIEFKISAVTAREKLLLHIFDILFLRNISSFLNCMLIYIPQMFL